MRREFSKPVKREALKRSGGHCEASGEMYGLPAGHRCNALLSYGVEFDHAIADAIGGDPTLENCVCACIKCHKWKSTKHDTPKAAKTLRQKDKHLGIRGRKHNWGYRPLSPRQSKIGEEA